MPAETNLFQEFHLFSRFRFPGVQLSTTYLKLAAGESTAMRASNISGSESLLHGSFFSLIYSSDLEEVVNLTLAEDHKPYI